MKKLFKKTLFIFLILFVFLSCEEGCLDPLASNYNPNAKKSNDELCEYETPTTPLLVKAHHLFDSIPFALGSIYYDDFGTMIEFTRSKFYLAKNNWVHNSFDCYDHNLEYILADPETNLYQLGWYYCNKNYLLSDNNYSIELQVGVDSITNHIDPATYSNDHPLSYQSPSMHWQMGADVQTWSYLFVVLEGFADLNNNGIFEPGEIFVFHIGGDSFRGNSKSIDFNLSDTITALGNNSEILNCYKFDIAINWANIINNIDIKNNNFTHTMDNISLATQIANNCDNIIFEY